jgi:hypothetical protein
LQVNFREAANVNCGYPIAVWIGAFAVWMNAAGLAKAVFDDVLVEGIRADVLLRCEHVQLVARHKPQERSFARTHGAIASHRPAEFAFYLEHNLATVTATVIFHAISLLVPGELIFWLLLPHRFYFRQSALGLAADQRDNNDRQSYEDYLEHGLFS